MAKPDSATKWKLLAGTGIGILLAAGILGFFRVDVCEQQLTDGGTAVRVCRHLQASDPPVLAVGIAVLAILGVFFTEISALGISIKRIQAAEQIAKTADERAQTAQEIARTTSKEFEQADKEVREGLDKALPGGVAEPAPTAEGSEEQAPHRPEYEEKIRKLAESYNRTRWTMPSSDERTRILDRIVKKMISAWKDIKGVDVSSYLDSYDRGLRLAGFAYLIANPDPKQTKKLMDAFVKEDTPFGQYWALRALKAQVKVDSEVLDRDTRRRLEERLPELPGRTEVRLLREMLEGSQR
jgi:hypothetical protein